MFIVALWGYTNSCNVKSATAKFQMLSIQIRTEIYLLRYWFWLFLGDVISKVRLLLIAVHSVPRANKYKNVKAWLIVFAENKLVRVACVIQSSMLSPDCANCCLSEKPSKFSKCIRICSAKFHLHDWNPLEPARNQNCEYNAAVLFTLYRLFDTISDFT